jgi:Leucine-rich repeat (LRR) protein
MQNKPKEIVEVEKVLDLIIDDYNFEKNILECINISNYKLTKDKISKVKKHFKNLKRLFISKTEIEDLTFIDDLVLLSELTITNCNLKVIPLKKANNNLKIIDLSCNQIENIDFLKNYKNVKLIDFSENEITDILVLKNFNNLIKLNLSKNKIIDAKEKIVDNRKKLVKLDLD